jgi:hypothetical protein
VRASTALFALLFGGLATPGRAEPLFQTASGATRGGVPITAVGALDSPWAVALLVAELPDADLTPRQRAAAGAVARALAQNRNGTAPNTSAGADLAAIGGKAKARVDADRMVVALEAPGESLDDLLRLLDARIKTRKLLLPAQGDVPVLTVDEPAIAADATALAAPAHPDALATDGAVDDPKLLREVTELLLARARIVVVGPRAAPDLLVATQRALVSPLLAAPAAPRGAPLEPAAARAGTRLAELVEPDATVTTSRLWFLCLDAAGAGPKGAVLAALLDGRLERGTGAAAIAVDVNSPRPSRAPLAEGKIVHALEAVAATAPPDEAVDIVRQRVRAERLGRMKDPEALAWAFARVEVAAAVDEELAAIAAVTPADTQALARTCAAGPRVVVRRIGGRQ